MESQNPANVLEVRLAFADAYMTSELRDFEFHLFKEQIFGNPDSIDLLSEAKANADNPYAYAAAISEIERHWAFEDISEKPTLSDYISELGTALGIKGLMGDQAKAAIEHLAWAGVLGALGLSVEDDLSDFISEIMPINETLKEENMENDTDQGESWFEGETWQDAKEACASVSEEAGEITEAIYSAGGVAGTVAGPLLGDTVEENFEHVCELPENLYNAVDGIFSEETASPDIDPSGSSGFDSSATE